LQYSLAFARVQRQQHSLNGESVSALTSSAWLSRGW